MKAMELAKYIINKAIEFQKPISNLGLQKFLYLVHRDYLSETRKKLITDEKFIATQHGIIIKSVYERFRIYGAFLIEDDFKEELLKKLSFQEKRIIDRSIKAYLASRPIKLNEKIYKTGGVWERVYQNNKEDKVIPDEWIQQEALRSLATPNKTIENALMMCVSTE